MVNVCYIKRKTKKVLNKNKNNKKNFKNLSTNLNLKLVTPKLKNKSCIFYERNL